MTAPTTAHEGRPAKQRYVAVVLDATVLVTLLRAAKIDQILPLLYFSTHRHEVAQVSLAAFGPDPPSNASEHTKHKTGYRSAKNKVPQCASRSGVACVTHDAKRRLAQKEGRESYPKPKRRG